MFRKVLKSLLIIVLIFLHLSLLGADDLIDLTELMKEGEKFINENFDESFLENLDLTERTRVEALFKRIQETFHGEYVVDVAGLKEAAKLALPVLESYEETEPFAVWLRARMDYFEVANELKIIVPPPETKPGEPPKPPLNPAPEIQRKVWQKQVEKTPVPEKARTYVEKLKPVFAAERVPSQLVWVAEVESGFNPQARSPVGAVGLFQLMPETAKRFGLSLLPFDERKNPEKSAAAAARYLRILYGKFNDWRLALAAYNTGEGRVQRLRQSTGGKSFDAIATKLPAETQMYVPRIEAVLLKREGIKLSELTGIK
ncbi:MAG: lytic transglycosylase domain-containing protein [Verrucomicrobiae bacterium]|nr:lytic transglycosylase domain-containing protein [Verrucomicrobiae bacterium]